MLYIAAVAKEAIDKSEITRQRLRRVAAAAYLTDKLGPNVSPNTLRSWPIPYKQLGRDATYEIRDLDAFAEARIAAAAVRRAGPAPAPDFAAMYEARVRLIPDGDDDWRLRSFEFVVNAYCSHFGVDLETAKRAVADAIATAAKIESLKTATEGGARNASLRSFHSSDHQGIEERMRDVTLPNIVPQDVTVDHVITRDVTVEIPRIVTPIEKAFIDSPAFSNAEIKGRIIASPDGISLAFDTGKSWVPTDPNRAADSAAMSDSGDIARRSAQQIASTALR